jgi:hypothetical protein
VETEQAALISEQLTHAVDLLRADIKFLDLRMAALEKVSADVEQRLRAVNEVATQFRFLLVLAGGGGLMGVLALLRELLK